jgi:hypothetical protein
MILSSANVMRIVSSWGTCASFSGQPVLKFNGAIVDPCTNCVPPGLKRWAIFLINGVRSSGATRSKQSQLKLSILAITY